MENEFKITQDTIDSFSNLQCGECGSLLFVNIFELKVISKLYSPTGQEMIYPSPIGFKCSECGELENFHEVKAEPDNNKLI